jgi:hypothetical protein
MVTTSPMPGREFLRRKRKQPMTAHLAELAGKSAPIYIGHKNCIDTSDLRKAAATLSKLSSTSMESRERKAEKRGYLRNYRESEKFQLKNL